MYISNVALIRSLIYLIINYLYLKKMKLQIFEASSRINDVQSKKKFIYKFL